MAIVTIVDTGGNRTRNVDESFKIQGKRVDFLAYRFHRKQLELAGVDLTFMSKAREHLFLPRYMVKEA